MQQYKDLLSKIMVEGEEVGCRASYADGVPAKTLSIFGEQLKFDLSDGFPLTTLSKKSLNFIITELLWFCQGCTNIRPLLQEGNTIWSEWPHEKYKASSGDPMPLETFESKILADTEFAEKWGCLGPVYGKQWRDFGGVDQLGDVIQRIKTHPDCRRLIVSAWNPPEIPDMALPPCHMLFQFKVLRGCLHLRVDQRSVDALLGLPYNIASYAALLTMVAKLTGLPPKTLTMQLGDCHIYDRHYAPVKTLLSRSPKVLPTLSIEGEQVSVEGFKLQDFKLKNYNPHPHVKGEIAI